MAAQRLFIPIVQLAVQRTPDVQSILKNFEEMVRVRSRDTAMLLREAVAPEVERIADSQLTDEDQRRLQEMMLERVRDLLRTLGE